MSWLAAALALTASVGVADADRRYEGDWYVSDRTDNVTGEREVDAFQHLINDSDYVTVRLRCHAGKPTLFVEWADQVFPEQTVLTISPILSDGTNPKNGQYMFEKSEDPIERGLRATTATSAQIVLALQSAKGAQITAYPSSGTRTVGIDLAGTQGAWARVSRHCPVRILPVPPQ